MENSGMNYHLMIDDKLVYSFLSKSTEKQPKTKVYTNHIATKVIKQGSKKGSITSRPNSKKGSIYQNIINEYNVS